VVLAISVLIAVGAIALASSVVINRASCKSAAWNMESTNVPPKLNSKGKTLATNRSS